MRPDLASPDLHARAHFAHGGDDLRAEQRRGVEKGRVEYVVVRDLDVLVVSDGVQRQRRRGGGEI